MTFLAPIKIVKPRHILFKCLFHAREVSGHYICARGIYFVSIDGLCMYFGTIPTVVLFLLFILFYTEHTSLVSEYCLTVYYRKEA
jgi:hypothetical protein